MVSGLLLNMCQWQRDIWHRPLSVSLMDKTLAILTVVNTAIKFVKVISQHYFLSSTLRSICSFTKAHLLRQCYRVG